MAETDNKTVKHFLSMGGESDRGHSAKVIERMSENAQFLKSWDTPAGRQILSGYVKEISKIMDKMFDGKTDEKDMIKLEILKKMAADVSKVVVHQNRLIAGVNDAVTKDKARKKS